MTPKRRARLALSILCEPGDPRLPGLLAAHTPVQLVDAIRTGDRLGSDPWPASWTHRAQSRRPTQPASAGWFRAIADGPTGSTISSTSNPCMARPAPRSDSGRVVSATSPT